jgi:hypothetical protein
MRVVDSYLYSENLGSGHQKSSLPGFGRFAFPRRPSRAGPIYNVHMTGDIYSPTSPLPRPPFEVSALARVSLAHPEMLPAEPGVYLALDDATRVWYVGIATSIRDRLTAHDRMHDFRARKVTSIAWKGGCPIFS